MPRKKRARRRAPSRERNFYYRAVSIMRPTETSVLRIPWIKLPFLPPEFKVIEILQGNPTPSLCHASRGQFKFTGDRVCWVNRDNREHVIQFLNGQWPFKPSQNPGDEKITIPACSGSAWYAMAPLPGPPQGVSVTYDYYIDVAPPPPGPSVIGDD